MPPPLDDQNFIHVTGKEENVTFLVPISIPRSALGLDRILKIDTKDQGCQMNEDEFLTPSETPDQILNAIRGFWINSEDYYTCDRISFDCVYDIVMFPPSSNHEEMKTKVYNLWNEECMIKLRYDQSRGLNCFI